MNFLLRAIVLLLMILHGSQTVLMCMQPEPEKRDRFAATKALLHCLCDDTHEKFNEAMRYLQLAFPRASKEWLIAFIAMVGVGYVLESYVM